MTTCMKRRAFLSAVGGAGAAAMLRSVRPGFAQPLPPADFGLEAAGKIKPRPSISIAASPLSIGFETLDRKMFEPEKTYPHLAELGVKWARCQTGWARTERTRGEYDFAWLDEVVDSLRRIGIQPWFNLGYGNQLYTPDAPHESAVGWAPIFTPEARAAWLAYVRKIAEHFAGRVAHWEIWNEPNITNFWQPQKPRADDYVEMVRITAPEIRARVPKAVIIGGAFAGVPKDYLRQCLALGMGDYVDKISYHPYRAVPEANYEADVSALRDAIAAHKPSLGLWQGENGCPSQKGGSGALADLDWNEARQAKWLLRRILNDLRLGIELTSYFHTVDLINYVWSSGQSGKTNFKGILRGNTYERKPSYYAYQSLCALFDAETHPTEMLMTFSGLPPAGGETPDKPSGLAAMMSAAFLRNDIPLFAYWRPLDLMKDTEPVQIEITLGGTARLRTPVLADPLTGQVYRIRQAEEKGDLWTLRGVPATDYPLLISDAALFAA
ncbi:MAG: beta-galactosidase [Candidatus Sumerlaeia bacterium]|nr:beta-galactosidase [Candidatus Sumerlaeia bacterium]